MKYNSFIYYLIDGFRMLCRNGIKAIIDPVNLFREYIQVILYKKDHSLAMSLDYSPSDLTKNKELMERFDSLSDIEVKSINWFIPYLRYAYGGVYTLLRFANYFHCEKGIRNQLIFFGNPSGSAIEIKKKIGKFFPELLAEEVIIWKGQDVNALPYADICIATQWKSAYLVLKFNKTKGKFYFIQDYEPLFYPAGTLYALAESTYRFGFYGITNTPGLYEMYTRDYNGSAEYFVPSVDKEIFYPSKREPIKSSTENPFTIFFYARPGTPRNAFELGIAALEKIKNKYGERVKIYTAGSAKWHSRNYKLEHIVDNLGLLPYEETSSLYRKCDLGIVFMFTKHPSYLPFELMACGCVVLTNYNPATVWFLKDGFNCVLTEPSISWICEKIELVMNDLDLRKQIISNALNSIANTSWDSEIEKIYRFICKRQAAARGE